MKNPTWRFEDGTSITLLTVEELRALPAGTKIKSIMGDKSTIGVDEDVPDPDEDTRGGYTAWGIDKD